MSEDQYDYGRYGLQRAPKIDIVDRLKLLARGDNLDLADIVCADAVAEIEQLRSVILKPRE